MAEIQNANRPMEVSQFLHVYTEDESGTKQPLDRISEKYSFRLTHNPIQPLAVTIANWVEKPIKVDLLHSTQYFLRKEDWKIIGNIAKKHRIPDDRVFRYTYLAPGHLNSNQLDEIDTYPTIAVIGDVHHSINPLTYLAESIEKLRPYFALYASSIGTTDLIPSYFGIKFSLISYQQPFSAAYLGLSPESQNLDLSRLHYHGSKKSPHHPRRHRYVGALSETIEHKPFTTFSEWYEQISENSIYFHTSLNGNFSHHISFPMQKAGILAVDAALANNRYFEQLLIGNKTCIVYESTEDLLEQKKRLSNRELKGIATNAKVQVDRFFPPMKIQKENGLNPFPFQPDINNEALNNFRSLRRLLSDIDRLDFYLLINILEILQEIHRFAVKQIPICVGSDCILLNVLRSYLKRFYFFKLVDRLEDSIILISGQSPPSSYKILWFSVLNNEDDRDSDAIFSINDYASSLNCFCYFSDELRVWPQVVNTRLRIIQITGC